jgi:hypothetical protein
VPAQISAVAGGRDQRHDEAKRDLHGPGKPWRVDDPDQVVIDEPIAVTSLASAVPEEVLQRRQRAAETDQLDQDPVDHGRDVQPDHTWPAPGEEDAARHEADEQKVDDDDDVSGHAVPHRATAGKR